MLETKTPEKTNRLEKIFPTVILLYRFIKNNQKTKVIEKEVETETFPPFPAIVLETLKRIEKEIVYLQYEVGYYVDPEIGKILHQQKAIDSSIEHILILLKTGKIQQILVIKNRNEEIKLDISDINKAQDQIQKLGDEAWTGKSINIELQITNEEGIVVDTYCQLSLRAVGDLLSVIDLEKYNLLKGSIYTHNHPNGCCDLSGADKNMAESQSLSAIRAVATDENGKHTVHELRLKKVREPGESMVGLFTIIDTGIETKENYYIY